MATFDDFMKLDIRVGTILAAKVFEKARKPAYQLTLDFGGEIGIKNRPLRLQTVILWRIWSGSRCLLS